MPKLALLSSSSHSSNSQSTKAPFTRLQKRKHLRRAAVAGLTALTLSLAACGSPAASPGTQSGAGRPVVLTTFTVLADIAQNVAGDKLQVESITKAGAEIHGYEPTPGDIRRAGKADLILDNGMGLEAWFEQFVQDVKAPHAVVTKGVKPINIAEDAYKDLPNPHAWMSPANVQIYVNNMVAAFQELDPANADVYESNGAAYNATLQEVQDELIEKLSILPASQRALVSCEGAFSYLARDAGLTEKYIWAVNAEQQATPQQIAGTIEFVRANNVPAVFCESTVSAAPMERVVEATDAVFGGTLYVDSLSEADGPSPPTLS